MDIPIRYPDGTTLRLWRVEYKLWDGQDLQCFVHGARILATSEASAAEETRHFCASGGFVCEIVSISEIASVSAVADADCKAFIDVELRQKIERVDVAAWEELKRLGDLLQEQKEAVWQAVEMLEGGIRTGSCCLPPRGVAHLCRPPK